MNEIPITVHGNVVAEPVERQGRAGIFTTFRVATTPYTRTPDGKYVDKDTSFYDVIAFKSLAGNVVASVKKGQPVVVIGKVSMRRWVDRDGTVRNNGEITAEHVGHDLARGQAQFTKVSRAQSLGLDPTSDPDVRADLPDLPAEGARSTHLDDFGDSPGPDEPDDGYSGPDDRPANVDENGEVHDSPFGDPETDPYTLKEPLPA